VATVLDPVTQHLQEMREEIKRLREEQRDPERVLGPLRQELEGLRIVVGEVLGSQMSKRVEGLPGDVMEVYQSLVSHGVNPQVAHHLLRAVVETLGTAGLGNREALKSLLWERMEGALAVSGPAVSRHYGQKIMMLVGPTGVGKTTTIAKLAGLARQQDEHRRTVLITLDTYRVAAVEQLRVFAKILKIPLEVAVSHKDFVECMKRHQEADLILIDTAGRSPKDQAGHDELIAITRGQFQLETHLVLAAPMAESVQMETIRRYQSIPIHKLIITKLDEMPTGGSLYNVLSQTGLPVSYLSAGQRVPEDLEMATRQRLVELVWDHSRSQVIQDNVPLMEVAH
jgi:flagellar biosynthesis protein FlhF